MDEQEIAVRLASHDKEIGHIKHRLDALEHVTSAINELALAMQKQAMNIESILLEIGRHNARLESLERQPAETQRMVKQGIINTAIGGALGAAITKILTLF